MSFDVQELYVNRNISYFYLDPNKCLFMQFYTERSLENKSVNSSSSLSVTAKAAPPGTTCSTHRHMW